MPQIIDVPGVGELEFPDEMGDDQIAEAIDREFGTPRSGPDPFFKPGGEINWDSPDFQKHVDKMQRDYEMQRAVGRGMESGTELVAALGQTLQNVGLLPSNERSKSVEERVAERVTPGLSPEKAALERERLTIAEEGVPMGWRMGAAAHTGLAKGMQLPSTLIHSGIKLARMTPGVDISEHFGRGVARDIFGINVPNYVGNWNDEYFRRVAEWEKWMSEQDAKLGAPTFLTQLSEGTARGFAELPAQMLGGLGGSTPQLSMRGAAIGAGVTSGAMRFSQELGEGTGDITALSRGLTSGLITGLTTRAFGQTGVEAIFRKDGVKGIANRIKDALVQAGYEGAEEAVDTFQQDLVDRIAKDPNRPISDTVNDVLLSGSVGMLLGGGMAGVHALGGDRNARKVIEATKVHGDVRPQAEGQPPVSAEEGGQRVQPDVTEEEYLMMEREGMGEGDMSTPSSLLQEAITAENAGDLVVMDDLTEYDAEQGSEAHDHIAMWDPERGKVVIDPIAWANEMRATPPEKRKQMARSILNEEVIHSATDQDDMLNFYNLSSWAERRIGRYIYAGKHGGRYTDAQIGSEMLRRRVQRINKMTPAEMVLAAGAEKWTLNSLEFIEQSIFKARELMGTKASKQQLAALDRTMANLQKAKTAVVEAEAGGGGDNPFAIARSAKVKDILQRLDKGEAFPNNTAALEAGLEAESVDDLDALLEARRDVQIRLKEARANKDLNTMMGLVGPNQFLREAIEAATSSGSHRVDLRKFGEKDLPEPKLDWRKNSEVRDWLMENGPELGIEISGQFARRRAIPREKAAAIAKDLIEGGINTHHNVRLTAEGQGVSEDEVRRIKKILLKGGKDQILSYADAIENGWEDEALGLKDDQGSFAMSRAAEKRIAKLREQRLAEIAASEREELDMEQINSKIIGLSNKSRESMLTENEQAELSSLRRLRFEKESGFFARRRGMTQREARLEEQRRRIMQMQAEARGEEFPEELKHKQPSSAYPAVAPEERVGASEAGALPRLTNEDISAAAQDILAGEIKIRYRAKSAERLERDVEASNQREEEGIGRTGDLGVSAGRMIAERPNFREFADWAKRNVGGIEPHQIRQIWEDNVWGMLLKAQPERIEEWRKALGLEKKYGKSVIHEEATAEKRQGFKKEAEAPDLTIQGRVQRQREFKSVEASQRYRGKVVEAIANKLISESMDDRPSLDRGTVNIEDVDFGNPNAKFSPYQELSAEDIANPDILKAVLRDQARASNTDPESASRRLIAVVDKTTGKVELLSTYNDAGVQRVVDPAGARLTKKPHRELNAQFLRQYRPIGSLLLKDPVRAFRQKFESVGEFQQKLATEAKERSAVGEGFQTADPEFKAEGTPGIEGEGGYLIGKHKAASGVEISRPGSMESDTQLSQPEVERMVDAIWNEVGQFDDADDVRLMVKALEERAKSGKISASDRVVISAFRKIHNLMQRKNPNIVGEIEKENPDWTAEKVRKAADEALMDEMADQIFTISEVVESRGELLRVMMSAFEGMSQGRAQPEAKSKYTRELTMPIERRAPTDVRAENLPPGVEPVVGKPKPKPQQREAYIPEVEPEEAPVPRTPGEKVAERAEMARHRQREIEMNEIWDEAINEPHRTNESKRQMALRIRREIYDQTKVLLTEQQAMDALVNKTGTPEERVEAVTEKVEKSLAPMTRLQIAAAELEKLLNKPVVRKPGEVYTSGKRVHPSLRVKERGPAALRRTKKPTLADIAFNALHDIGSGYDQWMTDRIDEYGGAKAKEFAASARKIADREKELYGGLTPLLDRARKLSGGVEPAKSGLLTPGKYLSELPGRAKASIDAQRAMNWLNQVNEITPTAAVARTVRAIEGTLGIPKFAEKLIEAAKAANIEIGKLVEPVVVRSKKVKKFFASGRFQRNMTSLGYDIIRQGGGDLWDSWTEGLAEANKHVKGVDLNSIQAHFRKIKKALDDPLTNDEVLEKINQDMARMYPRVVTHVKMNKMWQPVIHSDLFNYLENAARRATHVRAFRETFPATKDGKKAFKSFVKEVKAELTGPVIKDLNGLIRAMNGHPTDDYGAFEGTGFAPQEVGGQAMRLMNQTVNQAMGKAVLTGQMFVQPGEVAAGSTPVFFGYQNYLKAAARYGQLYKLLELTGARNPVMHDYTFNPTSPVRSLFKIGSNVISKVSMQNALNELQEGLAAATARVVAENISSKNLTDWEKRMLPQTFRVMGFNKADVAKLMAGDPELLNQFQRKAAAFLTGGNKAIAESSRLGANRFFNSIFRFQTYPMIKMKQTRGVLTNWADTMRTGSGDEKWAATRLAGRFLFGNAAQGALTAGITALAYGGMSGLKIRMKEAEDEPFTFFMESMLASISGPAYLLWRGKSLKGPAGYGEAAARLAFPYAVLKDMNDAAMGFGQYKDRPWYQRVGIFLKNKTPGTKAIGTGMAMFGLSQQNQQLDEAVKALSRWRRDNLGFTETQAYLNEDYRQNFRMNMKRAIDAMRVGDQEKFNEAWVAALQDEELMKRWMENPEGPDMATRVGQSFKARKMLVDPDGSELSDEQKEALRKHIGDDAYEALEYYDLMLEQAAEGVLLPRSDR